MHRLQWQGFRSWLAKHPGSQIDQLALVNCIADIRKEFCPEKFEKLIQSEAFKQVFIMYEEFCRENNGPMKIFWNSYLDMVELMLCFIRATREGNWKLHLNCVKDMLPWFFAYDHTNYSRYLPVYLLHMFSIEDTNPEAHKILEDGVFSVQRTREHGFSRLPVDQTIEQTLNKNTKTKGGIVGFSLKRGAVQRWMLTAPSRAAFVNKCRDLAYMKESERRIHKEGSKFRIQKDEECVKQVMEVIED